MTVCPDCIIPVGDDGACVRCYRAPDDVLREKADAALLDAARCFPRGVLARVAAVLRAGGADRGVEPHQTGGGQTREDHIRHAIDHVYGAAMGDESEPHIDHAIARLVLARGLELATAGGSGQR